MMPKGNHRIIIDDLEESEAVTIKAIIIEAVEDEDSTTHIPYSIQDCITIQVYKESRTGHRWSNLD